MNDDFVGKKGIRWNPKEMLNKLAKQLEFSEEMYELVVRERDYERQLCDNYQKKLLTISKMVDKLEHDVVQLVHLADADDDSEIVYVIRRFLLDVREEI